MVADIAYLQQSQQQISQLETLFQRQREAFRANPMPSAEQRIQWLKSLRELLFAAIPKIGPQPQDACATALVGARISP